MHIEDVIDQKKEQAEVLSVLMDNTHAFLTPEFVEKANKAFGTSIKPYSHKADGDRNPKGLTLDSGAKSAIGLASFELAPILAAHLGAEYEGALGRGTEVRRAVEAIRRKLNIPA